MEAGKPVMACLSLSTLVGRTVAVVVEAAAAAVAVVDHASAEDTDADMDMDMVHHHHHHRRTIHVSSHTEARQNCHISSSSPQGCSSRSPQLSREDDGAGGPERGTQAEVVHNRPQTSPYEAVVPCLSPCPRPFHHHHHN